MDENLKVLAHQVVEKIARKIKREAKEQFHAFGRTVGLGADGTPTKYVDQLAEDIALKQIKKSKIKVNVLSEEAGFLDFGGDYTFVLDPVDGTRNAYRGIPLYAVSLAIGTEKISDVTYGIVKNIPTGDLFVSEKHHGAFFNGKPIQTCDCPPKDRVSSLTLGKNHDDITLSLSKHHIVRSLGSASLEMCMVAIGGLDYYVLGKSYLRVIDIAAATLIVREAGGFVKTIDGAELDMNFTLDERTSLLVACSEEIVEEILAKQKT